MTSKVRYRAELVDGSFVWVSKDARPGDIERSPRSKLWTEIRKVFPINPVTNPLLQIEELPLFDAVD